MQQKYKSKVVKKHPMSHLCSKQAIPVFMGTFCGDVGSSTSALLYMINYIRECNDSKARIFTKGNFLCYLIISPKPLNYH